jgi:hypothetical protein
MNLRTQCSTYIEQVAEKKVKVKSDSRVHPSAYPPARTLLLSAVSQICDRTSSDLFLSLVIRSADRTARRRDEKEKKNIEHERKDRHTDRERGKRE